MRMPAVFFRSNSCTLASRIGTISSTSISASSSRALPVPAFMKSFVRPSWYFSRGMSSAAIRISKKAFGASFCMNSGRCFTTLPWISSYAMRDG
jgi:hypothetical protein